MATINSDREAEHARAGDGPRGSYAVKGAPGLALRVTASGVKTWTLRYRRHSDGKLRRMTLGAYPDVTLKEARERARAARNDVSGGADPANDKRERRHATTFADLFGRWYEGHAKRKLDAHADELRRYELHVRDAIGEVPAAELRRHDVTKVRDDVADKAGPVQSNRVLALVNRVLNYAVEEGLLEVNVAARMRKAGDEKPRERVLTDDELRALWTALDECEKWEPNPGEGNAGRPMSLAIVRAVRLLILTGQRRGEVIGATRAELALDAKPPVWTIPGDRTKNGELHRVPLAPLALYELRRALAEAGPSPHAFPSPKRDEGPTRKDAVTKALQRLCKRIGIEGVGPHDLRRTVGTGLARLRVPPDIRSLVLNHTRGRAASETTRVYDRHGYDDEKLEALTKWETHVRTVLSGEGVNVVQLAPRA